MIRLTRRLQGLPIRSVRLSSSAAPIKPQFGIVPRRPRLFNWRSTFVFFAAGAALAYSELIFEWYAEYTEVRTDPKETIKLDFQLRSHPLYQKLVHPVTGKDWVKLSSWENLDRNILDGGEQNLLVKTQKEYQVPQLTNHTLAVPGAIAVKPVIFHNKFTDETITFVHMGHRLCGYPFIIHGGMIATLLNETFKRNASLSGTTLSSLKTDYMVENISISYRAPSLANQFFVVKTKQVAAPEPKLYKLTSAIESEKGKVLVQAEASLRDTGRISKSAAPNASTWKDKLSPLFGSTT